MRQVHLIETAAAITRQEVEGCHVLVMDVLRATSTILTALANGAKSVIPVETVEEALRLKAQQPDCLLGGERGGIRPEGFDCGNSPLEYTEASVCGQTVILTTTNGTRALVGCRSAGAASVGCAGFLNGDAAVRRLLARAGDLALVCAGTKDRFSLDDFLCAGMLIQRICQAEIVNLSDMGWNALLMYKAYGDKLAEALAHARHYQVLQGLGFSADLVYCLTKNRLDIAPEYDGREIRIG